MTQLWRGFWLGALLLVGCSEKVSLGGTGSTTATGRTSTGSGSTTTGGGSLVAGAACSGNSQCQSGVCGVDGGGNCCTATCAPGADPACNATACDSNGQCVYNFAATCGTCSDAVFTSGLCGVSGDCNSPGANPCPDHLTCNAAATGCLGACHQTSDCVGGFYCESGSCLAILDAGPCTSDEGCATGICGVHGVGHCCAQRCDTSDPNCGAIDCDPLTTACDFPPPTTLCGDGGTLSCVAGVQSTPSLCNGAGTCVAATTVDCAPYECGTTTCLSRCNDATECVAGSLCDTGACCAPFAAGGTMEVDNTNGSDSTNCCGRGSAGPCKTLTHAMALIDQAEAKDVIIHATVAGGGDWADEPAYPVVLGWGVEVDAPGVYFLDTTQHGNSAIFQVAPVSLNDGVGYASIVGTAANPIGVGVDSTLMQVTGAAAAIDVEPKNTLYIANAVANASTSSGFAVAILVNPRATLTLGQDKSGANTGTVTIGNDLGAAATDGVFGIFCESDQVSSGCTINDAHLVGVPSLVIEGQEAAGLAIQDWGNVILRSNPVFGVPPTSIGFGGCPSKTDAINPGGGAILVSGPGNLVLSNATLQCIGGIGILAEFDQSLPGTGAPLLAIDRATIQNTNVAIEVSGGTATLTKSTLKFNAWGVYQLDDSTGLGSGKVDLSGGGNSVVCSSNVEASPPMTDPGISVYNAGSAQLDADNTAFDTSGPDYFDCDSQFATCTCNNLNCVMNPGSDAMSAVEDTTLKGGVSFKGSTLSVIPCN